MKGTRVNRYKCLFIFSYFRLCGRVHFFNHVPSRSIGFPAFFTPYETCVPYIVGLCIVYIYIYIRVYLYITYFYLFNFFFSVGQKHFSAYLFYYCVYTLVYVSTQKETINGSFDRGNNEKFMRNVRSPSIFLRPGRSVIVTSTCVSFYSTDPSQS